MMIVTNLIALAVLAATPAPALKKVEFNSPTVIGGNTVEASVTLSAKAKSSIKIALMSSDEAVLKVPPTVTVGKGTVRAAFYASTGKVKEKRILTVTASLGGASLRAKIDVLPQQSQPEQRPPVQPPTNPPTTPPADPPPSPPTTPALTKIVIAYLPFHVIGNHGDKNDSAESEMKKVLDGILHQPTQSAYEVVEMSATLRTWHDVLHQQPPVVTDEENTRAPIYNEEELQALCRAMGANYLISGTLFVHEERSGPFGSATFLGSCDVEVFTPKARVFRFIWEKEVPATNRKNRPTWFSSQDHMYPELVDFDVLRREPDKYSSKEPKGFGRRAAKAAGVAVAKALFSWYKSTFPDKE